MLSTCPLSTDQGSSFLYPLVGWIKNGGKGRRGGERPLEGGREEKLSWAGRESRHGWGGSRYKSEGGSEDERVDL